MGQNFLVDPSVADAICAHVAKVAPKAPLLEIGPGLGAISERLVRLESPKYAGIEIDRRLVAHLLAEKVFTDANLTLGDALESDWDEMYANHSPACLVGNLPYSLSSPLLAKFVLAKNFANAVLMLQRETADRVCAPTGSNDYNAFSA